MKRREEGRWDKAWGGIASLGLALPVLWTGMRARKLRLWRRIAEWMAAGPARLAGLDGKKGMLAAGADADFVVFDPDTEWTVTPDHLHFRHKISPYLGANLRGTVRETWLRGERVFSRGTVRQASRAAQELVRAMRERALRAIAECRHIATMTEEPGRITRRFLTPPTHDVHAHLRARMESLGMTVQLDAAGNLRGRSSTTGQAARDLGSHIDTVPDAGAFDGVLGVMLALECVDVRERWLCRWRSK